MFLPCMAYCSTAGYGWSGQAISCLPMIKAWFLSVLVSLLLVGTAAGQRPSLQDPALYAAVAHGAKPLPKAAKRVPYKLRPGVAVFGWFPHWLPDSTYGHYDYSLLSHVAYYGYQATNQGGLLSPTGNPTGLVQAAHQGKASCKVLLSISYREPATGTSLFDTVRTAERHALAGAIVAQVIKTKANGVNLDLSFARRISAAKRPNQQQAARTQAALQQRGVALAQTREKVRRDSILLFNVTQQRELQHFAGPPEASPAEGEKVAKKQAAEKQKADAAQKKQTAALDNELTTRAAKLKKQAESYQKKLALYQRDVATFRKKMTPPPAVLQDFVEDLVQALRQQNPDYVLTLTVPAVDSAAAYTRLTDLAPLVQLFVLKACDYTATRPVAQGPLSPLQASGPWGAASVATSVQYYLQGGVPPAQLLVTFAQVGKVWADGLTKPRAGRPNPAMLFRYVPNQVWRAWPVVSQRRDAMSGSVYVQFGANPDSAAAGRPQITQAAWVDDSTALAAKYAWVVRQHLGGVGIWALGYEAASALAGPLVSAGLVQAPAAASVLKPAAGPLPVPDRPDKLPKFLDELSPGLNVFLFVLAVLLAFALAGFGLGVALNMRHIIPFRSRLARSSLLLGRGLAVLGIYLLLLLNPNIVTLLIWGLPALSIAIILLIRKNSRRLRTLP